MLQMFQLYDTLYLNILLNVAKRKWPNTAV